MNSLAHVNQDVPESTVKNVKHAILIHVKMVVLVNRKMMEVSSAIASLAAQARDVENALVRKSFKRYLRHYVLQFRLEGK